MIVAVILLSDRFPSAGIGQRIERLRLCVKAGRTRNEEEATPLEKDGCGKIFFGERELARAVTHYVLERLPVPAPRDVSVV